MESVIRVALSDALAALGIDIDYTIEHPADRVHGDYASNVALMAAKVMGTTPREVAEQLRTALAESIEYVDRIDIAGPGFLNFYLSRDFFTNEVMRASSLGEAWGTHRTWEGKRVVVEYTDPNPFKEFHIGHMFTNTVGESIARLFMAAGADVRRVNYQGDVGLHVAHAIFGMRALGIGSLGVCTSRELGRAYAHGARAYKEDEQAKEEIRRINQALYARNDAGINELYDLGRKTSLAYFEEVYRMLGTHFDEYFFESDASPRGAALVLDHPDIFKESDGAHVFHGEDYGLHTRVFLNKEGLPTYEAKELALAKLKHDRIGGYDHSVISTANEITEYFKVLLCAMRLIYPELAAKTEHIGHGTVRLSTGKMSSRTGDVIAAVDFIEEVKQAALAKMASVGTESNDHLALQIAIAAIKFATLKTNILQDSVFDKEQAVSFEGNSGPYLQYTYARIQSLLQKAKQVGVAPNMSKVPDTVYGPEALVYRFPEVVAGALADRAPHQVAHYLLQLAGSFNSFYATEKIADATDSAAPYKAALAQAVGQTIKNGLYILGVEAPERM